ncbi:MAG: hypothetical protein JO208_08665 [Alphaproteobacteria bacterium]|nr:hypothetical protein [Alphaproteobacteria bacterium]
MSKYLVLALLALAVGLNAVTPAAAAAEPQTCIAINEARLDAGYLFSAEFEVVDPQARDLAAREWEQFAQTKGFESVGCDSQHLADESAALPHDAKIIRSGWVPSHDALFAGNKGMASGKRSYRSGTECLQVTNGGLLNKCGYPVSVAYCFQEPLSGAGSSYDKTCAVQKFGNLLSLAAGATGELGTFQHVFYFACENPAAPVGMQFDGNGVSGVCTAP